MATLAQAARVERLPHVDNLRALMVAWIIGGHALLGYSAIGGWPYDEVKEATFDTRSELAMAVVVGPSALFVIGTFFFVAGLFAPGAMARKGPSRFAADRLIRLGIPFAMFVLLVWPLFMWFAYLSAGYRVSFWWEFRNRHPFLDSGPLWFAEILLYVSLAYAAWTWGTRRFGRAAAPPSSPAAPALPSGGTVVGLVGPAIAPNGGPAIVPNGGPATTPAANGGPATTPATTNGGPATTPNGGTPASSKGSTPNGGASNSSASNVGLTNGGGTRPGGGAPSSALPASGGGPGAAKAVTHRVVTERAVTERAPAAGQAQSEPTPVPVQQPAEPAPRDAVALDARQAAPLGVRNLVVLAIGVAVASFIVRLWFPARSKQILDLHLWQWPQCVAMFGLGVAAARYGWARRVPENVRRACGLTMLGVLVGLPVYAAVVGISDLAEDSTPYVGGWHWQAFMLASVEAVLVVFGSVWVLGLAQDHLGKVSRFWRNCSRGAFAAFVLQAPVLITLSIVLRPFQVPAEAKALVVGALGVPLCFWLGWLLIDRTKAGRLL